MKPIKILVVDDEADLAFLMERKYKRSLQQGEWQSLFARNGCEALEICAAHPDIAVVVTDLRMPEMDGLTLLTHLSEQYPLICSIVITAYNDMKNIRAAMNRGAFDFLTKPLNMQDFEFTLQKTIRHHTKMVEQIATRRKAEQALQQSWQQYLELIEELADGVVITQHEKVVFVNEALCALLNGKSQDFLQITVDELFLKANAIEESQQGMSGQFSIDGPQWSVRHVTDTVGERWLEMSSKPIYWHGHPATLITVRDITGHKRRERELEQEEQRLEQENIVLRSNLKDRYKFGPLVGKSPAMQEVYELVARAAASDYPVLILGESGTGKELIAHTIHQMSRRSEKPFVAVNCGAIPANLFESELFGHRKGAFTGATADKPGRFERAHQGTLFLDEVGELITELQAKLLRVLDSGEYTPVGGHRVKHVDVRILAATNRDINELLHSGVMRRDFFHRLHVIAIQAPPLRKRLEDLPLLIEHILKKRVPDHLPLPPEVLSELYAHPWPGNVRELQNVIVRYAATQELTFSHGRPVPSTTRQSGMHMAQAMIQGRQTLRNALKAFEKQYILMTLERHNWHKTKTAAALGIPGRTFRDKLKSHGISGPPSS